MKSFLRSLPSIISLAAVLALVAHGPIAQLAHYHAFADESVWSGIPHAMDVFSNIGFVVAALYGCGLLLLKIRAGNTDSSFLAYSLFIFCLAATAVCSSYYHLAPDDARLFWDRLPIALACCSLLAAVRAEYRIDADTRLALMELSVLLMAGLMSVIWWQQSGDLRPYLFIQGVTLILIPLWLFIWKAATRDKLIFGAAILLYVLAKVTELLDAPILLLTHVLSGHSIKHLLAALAAGLIVSRLRERRIASVESSVPKQKIEVFRQTAS